MKKIIAIFLVLLFAFAPTLIVSESFAITRAVVKRNAYVDVFDYLVPSFLAKARLSFYGLRSCSDILEGERDSHYLVNFLAAAHSEQGNDKELIKKYLRVLKESGCSYDDLDLGGLPPAFGSILYNDYELVVFFVENGADIDSRLERPGKKSHGMNAFGFAKLLQEIEPEVDRKMIIEYLSEKI